MRSSSLVLATLISIAISGCSDTESNSPPKPTPLAEVDIAQPLSHKLTDWDEFTGRFEAINDVSLRARVTGYLVEKKFKDGQMVSKGDLLFVIDPRPFEYQLQRMQAEYALAEKEWSRANSLRQTRAIAQEEVDRRYQELQIAKATLNDAKLQLTFTEIRSPIDGKISDSYVDIGNLVEENGTLLTRIVSTNPIHFRFEGSQNDLLKYLRLDKSGQRPSSVNTPNPIYIKLIDEDKFYHQGKMHFVDNAVDESTGTIQATASVNNDSGLIYPGLFGRARLLGKSNYDALLVPESAINTDQDKKYVYIVDESDKVQRRYVQLGTLLDNNLIVVANGLEQKDHVVVNGIQRIRQPNQQVVPNMTQLTWTPIETLVITPEPSTASNDKGE
jgi:RND family efflux transporter MFP subunit